MIRKKKVLLRQAGLMLAFLGVLGIASKVRAAELVLPTSIHDILTPTQIEDLKARQEVKDIKIAKRAEVLADTSANIFSTANPLREDIKSFARWTVGGTMMTLLNAEVVQKMSFSDPNNPDGMAVRIAPSDAELFQ
ncbi:MAG: hypothetical protein WGN25_14530 [Candidatus Electrothrix sp. GW3-4]|uniref:hypothetical protein n=1 Tax=Candidatus Electrothrix sp. GW3-4 TaxID=3126740 RepID=UPI0030CCF309